MTVSNEVRDIIVAGIRISDIAAARIERVRFARPQVLIDREKPVVPSPWRMVIRNGSK
jgi:hypothetical protein